MDYILISIVAFIGAGLTLFSGFGLGTLLMPVFGLFFPIEIAIGMTAIVHFANNVIKLGFFYKHLNWAIIAKFGIPSVIAAYMGAYLLTLLTGLSPLFTYTIATYEFTVTPIKLTIALLLLFFSTIELLPKFSELKFDSKYLPFGGLLSGFFGGLSGNQGAFRSAFLIRSGLTKEAFVGTGVVIACFVDITRLSVYSQSTLAHVDESKAALLIAAIVSAFVGVYVGNRLIKKITIKLLQQIVASMIFVFSILLGFGIV